MEGISPPRQVYLGQELLGSPPHLFVTEVELGQRNVLDAVNRLQAHDGIAGHKYGDAVRRRRGVHDVAGPSAARLDLDGADAARRLGQDGEPLHDRYIGNDIPIGRQRPQDQFLVGPTNRPLPGQLGEIKVGSLLFLEAVRPVHHEVRPARDGDGVAMLREQGTRLIDCRGHEQPHLRRLRRLE